VSGQRHAPAALYSQERTPGTHWTGGWVGPRAGLDTQTTCLCRGSNPGRLVDRCVNNQNIGLTLQVVTCLVCQPCANRSLGLIETSHIKESRLIVLEEGRMCVNSLARFRGFWCHNGADRFRFTFLTASRYYQLM
jgi:hypothetical protein